LDSPVQNAAAEEAFAELWQEIGFVLFDNRPAYMHRTASEQ